MMVILSQGRPGSRIDARISRADSELKSRRISRLVGLIVFEIWAFEDMQLVENCQNRFSVKMHFHVALVSLTRHT
jgi:hypothetical protein